MSRKKIYDEDGHVVKAQRGRPKKEGAKNKKGEKKEKNERFIFPFFIVAYTNAASFSHI